VLDLEGSWTNTEVGRRTTLVTVSWMLARSRRYWEMS
jgi:hypothetical protein